MKKQLAAFVLVVSTSLMGGTASAFVSQPPTQSLTARATATGTKSASFSNVVLRPVDAPDLGGPNETVIGWTAAAGSSWQLARAVIRFNFNVTDRLGGVQIYTNNTAAGALPQFVDPTPGDPLAAQGTQAYLNAINPDSNPAGLLLGTSGSSSERMDMAWSIKGSSKTPTVQIAPMDPNNGLTVDAGAGTKFQWLYMLDKQTPAIDRNGDGDVADTVTAPGANPDFTDTVKFVDGNDFSTAVKFTKIHFGQGPADYGADSDKKAYIYFQANLDQAAPGDIFQTSTLTLEAFLN